MASPGASKGSLFPELRALAESELQGLTRFLFCDEECAVLCSSFKVVNPVEELSQIKGVFAGSREEAIRSGVVLEQLRFEVHRFDPPVVYGRTMSGDPHHSEGIAVCRVENGPTGRPAYGVISFALPELTAKQVPQLIQFCHSHLQAHSLPPQVTGQTGAIGAGS